MLRELAYNAFPISGGGKVGRGGAGGLAAQVPGGGFFRHFLSTCSRVGDDDAVHLGRGEQFGCNLVVQTRYELQAGVGEAGLAQDSREAVPEQGVVTCGLVNDGVAGYPCCCNTCYGICQRVLPTRCYDYNAEGGGGCAVSQPIAVGAQLVVTAGINGTQ